MRPALLAIFFGFLLAVIIPFRFRVRYLKKGKDDFLSLTWLVLPDIFSLSIEIPFMKINPGHFPPMIQFQTQLEGSGDNPMAEKKHRIEVDWAMLLRIIKDLPQLLKNFNRWRKILFWMAGKTSLRRFIWRMEVGTGDAAQTGILIGIIWSLLSNVYMISTRIFSQMPSCPELNVLPNFKEPVFTLDMDCIFAITGGHIIIGGTRMFFLLLKEKGGKIIERSSHRGINENSHGKHQGNGGCEYSGR